MFALWRCQALFPSILFLHDEGGNLGAWNQVLLLYHTRAIAALQIHLQIEEENFQHKILFDGQQAQSWSYSCFSLQPSLLLTPLYCSAKLHPQTIDINPLSEPAVSHFGAFRQRCFSMWNAFLPPLCQQPWHLELCSKAISSRKLSLILSLDEVPLIAQHTLYYTFWLTASVPARQASCFKAVSVSYLVVFPEPSTGPGK